MRTSLVPQLIDALVVLAKNLFAQAEVTVTDGPAFTNNPGDYLHIGCSDPFADGYELTAATTTQKVAAFRAGEAQPQDEDIDLPLCVVSYNSQADTKLARDRCYAHMGELVDALRTASNLGVDGLLWVHTPITTGLKYGLPEAGGIVAILPITIHCKARI